jgi:hypothetical protein
VRALRNRHAEGATREQLAAAVEGARHDEWLRQGRAKSAFAVVFASLASVDRFTNKVSENEGAARATRARTSGCNLAGATNAPADFAEHLGVRVDGDDSLTLQVAEDPSAAASSAAPIKQERRST